MSVFTSFKGTVVRAAKPEWSYAPTSGLGAAKHGGRFNPVGQEALYTSLDFNVCAREVRFSLNVSPYTFYYLAIKSTRIIDLRKSDTLGKLGVVRKTMSCENWESEMHRGLTPGSHKLARQLMGLGAHGILVPSFATGAEAVDTNLELWNWSEKGDGDLKAFVDVLERDKLPKDRQSWSKSSP